MNRIRVLWSCVLATALGATPGALLAWAGSKGQGFGLALIGGVIALGINLSSVWYGTSRSSSIRRILKGVALLLAARVLGADQLLSCDEEVVAPPGVARPGVFAPPEKLRRGLNRGMSIGAVIGGLLALAFGIWFFNDDAKLDQRIAGPFALLLAGLMGGGTWGAAGGMLTVRGRHRRNVILGALAGTVIGVGMGCAFAAMPQAKTDPVLLSAITTAMFATLGAACGVFAQENFSGQAAQEQSPPNEIEARREHLIRSTAARDEAPPEPKFDVQPKPAAATRQESGKTLSGWSIALMVFAVIVLLLRGFAAVNRQTNRQAQETRELQIKQQQQQWQEVEQSVRDGAAGPAIRRLFGVDEKSTPRRGSAPQQNSPQPSASP